MKHIIEFNLPEEQDELDLTMKAPAFVYAVQDFYDTEIRGQLKYNNDLSDAETKVLEQLKAKFFMYLEERNVSNLL